MTEHNFETLEERADARAAVLGMDEAFPDGCRYYVSEQLRELIREMGRLVGAPGAGEGEA